MSKIAKQKPPIKRAVHPKKQKEENDILPGKGPNEFKFVMKKNKKKGPSEKIPKQKQCLEEIRKIFFGEFSFKSLDTKSLICDRNVVQLDSSNDCKIYKPQKTAASSLFDKLTKMIEYNDKIQVHCYFLLPNKKSLEQQTLLRLRNFINKNRMNFVVPSPENLAIRLTNKEQAEDYFREMEIKRKANPNSVFLFFQDECHWGAGAGSVASLFTEKVLSIEGSYLIGVSATPNNQLVVFEKNAEWNELMVKKIVKLESDQYFGREKFIEEKNNKLLKCKTPATDIIIPMSYLCCIASYDNFDSSTSENIPKNEDEYKEINLADHHDTTKQVIDQLFKGGLVVLPLSGTKLAQIFAESFASILHARFPNNKILVCYSVSTDTEFIKSVNCNCTDLNFSNILHHHEACLLVVVGRARFGDTFPENFKYFDLRDKFRSNITWTPFYQMCGRAFGYGERPTLLLNKKSMKMFIRGNASKSDEFLKTIKEKNISNKSSETYQVDIMNPIENYSNKELKEVRKIIKKECENPIIIVEKSDLSKLEESDPLDIYFYGNNQEVYRVQKKSECVYENSISLEEALDLDLDPMVTNFLHLKNLTISNKHAANTSSFAKTFSKRIYLVAEPQMGKTGVMLALFKLIAKFYLNNNTPPGYPNIFSIAKQCKQIKQQSTQSFTLQNYGLVSLFDKDNFPKYYEKNSICSERTTIIQRIDKMKNSPNTVISNISINLLSDFDEKQKTNNKKFFSIPNDLKDVDWNSQKAPFIFITHGRSDSKINIDWINKNHSEKERIQIIVTTNSEYLNYKKKFESHSFIIVNTQYPPSNGYLRYCAICFAKEMEIKNIWLLDDDLDNTVEFKSIDSILPKEHWKTDQTQNGNKTLTLLDVVDYFENPNWQERSCYAICSPRINQKKNTSTKKNTINTCSWNTDQTGKLTLTIDVSNYLENPNWRDTVYNAIRDPGEKKQKKQKNAFSCKSGKGMSLVNVEKLANINYLPVEISDLEVAFHLIMNDELVCRFEIFGVTKIQMDQGCSNYIGQYETFPADYDEWDEGCLNIDLLDKLLPKCPENTGIKPIVAMYTPDTKCSKEIINSLNKGRKTHVFDPLSSKIETCKSITNNKTDFCGAFIETEHFFEALIYLNLILFKENGEQNERDEDKLRSFLLGVAEQMIERDTRLTKLRKEFNDNYSVKNLFQSVSTQFCNVKLQKY